MHESWVKAVEQIHTCGAKYMIRGHHAFIVRPLYLQFLMSFNNVLGERNSSVLCTITTPSGSSTYHSLCVFILFVAGLAKVSSLLPPQRLKGIF